MTHELKAHNLHEAVGQNLSSAEQRSGRFSHSRVETLLHARLPPVLGGASLNYGVG